MNTSSHISEYIFVENTSCMNVVYMGTQYVRLCIGMCGYKEGSFYVRKNSFVNTFSQPKEVLQENTIAFKESDYAYLDEILGDCISLDIPFEEI